MGRKTPSDVSNCVAKAGLSNAVGGIEKTPIRGLADSSLNDHLHRKKHQPRLCVSIGKRVVGKTKCFVSLVSYCRLKNYPVFEFTPLAHAKRKDHQPS